ncbi:hypothetical protein QAD02_005958 [Eretmocerus hayati]|uniref:Uncharacterized protein n=1 Tax=Eretmocerus hayati TaxID=131215 RepID=A0ACC2N023_9HYME|nr:hypothetical protein QAD02_005958 [Eretmocerus hayati]
MNAQFLENRLPDDLEKVMDNPKFSDFTLCTPKSEFKVHKVILMARSPVFAAMFEQNMKENQENYAKITDIDDDVLKEVLRYMYCAKVEHMDVNASERERCNKTVEIYEDVSNPVVTPETWGKPLTCWYRFRSFKNTPRDWILRVRFKKFKVGTLVNATTCLGGYMQVSHEKKNTRELFSESLYCDAAHGLKFGICDSMFGLIFRGINLTKTNLKMHKRDK